MAFTTYPQGRAHSIFFLVVLPQLEPIPDKLIGVCTQSVQRYFCSILAHACSLDSISVIRHSSLYQYQRWRTMFSFLGACWGGNDASAIEPDMVRTGHNAWSLSRSGVWTGGPWCPPAHVAHAKVCASRCRMGTSQNARAVGTHCWQRSGQVL